MAAKTVLRDKVNQQSRLRHFFCWRGAENDNRATLRHMFSGSDPVLLQYLPKTAAITPPPMPNWTLASNGSRMVSVRSKMVVFA